MMSHQPLSKAVTSPELRLLDRLASPLESLANLTFLALEEAEYPEKVRFYLRIAEEQFHVIRQIARETHTAQRSSSTSLEQ
jgi:hypothetical protein